MQLVRNEGTLPEYGHVLEHVRAPARFGAACEQEGDARTTAPRLISPRVAVGRLPSFDTLPCPPNIDTPWSW